MPAGAAPGERRGGRSKGTPNSAPNVRQAIEQAFDQVGGIKWLAWLSEKRPDTFAMLLGKVVPAQLELSGAVGSYVIAAPPLIADAAAWQAQLNPPPHTIQ